MVNELSEPTSSIDGARQEPPRNAEEKLSEAIADGGTRAKIRVHGAGFEITTRSALSDDHLSRIKSLDIVESYHIQGTSDGLSIWGEWSVGSS